MAKAEKKQVQTETKKGAKVVNVIVNILLVISILLAFVCTYTSFVTKKGSGVPSIFGYAPFSIQTPSMKDTFDEGDLIITKTVSDPTTLKEKDIITFWTIINGERVLNTHRIVSVEDGGSYVYFVTKGDNNTIADSMTVHQSEVVGIYLYHIDNLGSVLDFLQTSKGFFLIVVLPVLAFFIFYVVEFFRALFAYQAGKTREALAREAGVKTGDGEITLSEAQLQDILAKALKEATKKADAENADAETSTEAESEAAETEAAETESENN